ncbi:MAG: outer membrane beta-barrel protein [Chitinophagaceae bacterium]|nr:outer membrane beta-barrel protein [Chitinophagaceae bacterium]
MNKDMMNIDDFVRDKLGGHTEKEDPAAWLKMKALLDKEMPEKAAPFVFGWRKPAAFLGAALLIGALCVGGYQLNAIREKNADKIATTHHTSESNTKDHHTHTTATNSPHHNPDLLTAPDSPSPQSPDANGSLPENNTVSGGTAATSNPVAANRSSGNANASLAETNNAHMPGRRTATPAAQQSAATQASSGSTAASGRPQAGTKSGSSHHTTAVAQQEEATGADRKENVAKATASVTANRRTGTLDAGNTGTGSNSNAEAGLPAKKTAAKNSARVLNSASGSTATHKEIAAKNKKGKNSRAANHTPDEKGQELAKNKETANTKEATVNHTEEPKDSISAITVVTRESTSRGGYPKKITRITDTIAITKVPVIPVNNTIVSSVQPSKKEVKMAAAEGKKANKLASKKQLEQQKNVYASAAKVEVKENAGKPATAAQVESVVKVKKEKSAFTQWWENLPEAMADAKRDFKSAKFFWGLSGGVNYSSPNGSGGFQGVQFGPTGELVFNKHWSLFGAIKYFNRSGSKKMVSDNFSSQIAEQDSVQGANWYFTARTDSTNRYFNFSTVHSFEMPITLRYTIRKFYLMTGINLAYYLPVNVEKVEREYNNMNVHVIVTNSSKAIVSDPTKPQLNIADFGSRFGMGYVIGAGYQITPAWQVDMRIVNPFWDNAKGAGAQKLSKDFYKLPSVQLSFGYQINRIRNRATFGPNSAP